MRNTVPMRRMTIATLLSAGLMLGAAGVASAQASFTPPAGYTVSAPGSVTGDQLKGVDVYGPKDEKIAAISDVELAADGAATNIITDVGGFLGIGAKPVALKIGEIAVYKNAEGNLRAYTSLTKKQLEALPEYKAPK